MGRRLVTGIFVVLCTVLAACGNKREGEAPQGGETRAGSSEIDRGMLVKGELHLPDAERVFNPSRQTHYILDLAHSIGPKTHALCLALFDQRGREAQKTMWGVVRLVPRFPALIVEQAVETAVTREHHSLKAIRAIAEQLLHRALAELEEQPTSPAPPLTQQHDLIREPTLYAEFFNDSIRR